MKQKYTDEEWRAFYKKAEDGDTKSLQSVLEKAPYKETVVAMITTVTNTASLRVTSSRGHADTLGWLLINTPNERKKKLEDDNIIFNQSAEGRHIETFCIAAHEKSEEKLNAHCKALLLVYSRRIFDGPAKYSKTFFSDKYVLGYTISPKLKSYLENPQIMKSIGGIYMKMIDSISKQGSLRYCIIKQIRPALCKIKSLASTHREITNACENEYPFDINKFPPEIIEKILVYLLDTEDLSLSPKQLLIIYDAVRSSCLDEKNNQGDKSPQNKKLKIEEKDASIPKGHLSFLQRLKAEKFELQNDFYSASRDLTQSR